MQTFQNQISNKTLAIFGGPKIRPQSMPHRKAFGEDELHAIQELFKYYDSQNRDFGYQDHFEEIYTKKFVEFQNVASGYADAVCTGSIAVYLALAALQLPKGSEVIVSPITDPGTITAIIFNQLTPVIADSKKDSYNICSDSIESLITSKTRAILPVHAAGQAVEIEKVISLAKTKNLKVVEDCSQAHGARFEKKRVGTFGDIAAFSTMYRKAHGTGGCGGVVFSQNQELYRLALAYSDRGKPKWLSDFQEKDPSQFLFPALNYNQDEISCAIGIRTLAKLDKVIEKRNHFVQTLARDIQNGTRFCKVYPMSENDSPFFLPIFVDTGKINCTKIQFSQAVEAEGIVLNPHYRYLVKDWPWAQPYFGKSSECENAKACLDHSFNILLNEFYGPQESQSIVDAISKVENHFANST